MAFSVIAVCRLKGAGEMTRKEDAMMRVTISYAKGVLRITMIIRVRKDHPVVIANQGGLTIQRPIAERFLLALLYHHINRKQHRSQQILNKCCVIRADSSARLLSGSRVIRMCLTG